MSNGTAEAVDNAAAALFAAAEEVAAAEEEVAAAEEVVAVADSDASLFPGLLVSTRAFFWGTGKGGNGGGSSRSEPNILSATALKSLLRNFSKRSPDSMWYNKLICLGFMLYAVDNE